MIQPIRTQPPFPHPSGEYLLTAEGITPQYHDERFCLRVALEESARYFSLTGEAGSHHLRLDSYFPDSAPPRPVVFDDSGKPWATEFRREKDTPALFPEMRPLRVKLADGIELSGYRLFPEEPQAEQPLRVRLFWRVNQTPTQDYTLFLHLLYVDNEGLFEQLAGFDQPPGNGTCPMTEWLPAEMIVHETELNLPAVLPAGDLFLAVGFYTPADGRRMPVSLAADDHILVGPLIADAVKGRFRSPGKTGHRAIGSVVRPLSEQRYGDLSHCRRNITAKSSQPKSVLDTGSSIATVGEDSLETRQSVALDQNGWQLTDILAEYPRTEGGIRSADSALTPVLFRCAGPSASHSSSTSTTTQSVPDLPKVSGANISSGSAWGRHE